MQWISKIGVKDLIICGNTLRRAGWKVRPVVREHQNSSRPLYSWIPPCSDVSDFWSSTKNMPPSSAILFAIELGHFPPADVDAMREEYEPMVAEDDRRKKEYAKIKKETE